MSDEQVQTPAHESTADATGVEGDAEPKSTASVDGASEQGTPDDPGEIGSTAAGAEDEAGKSARIPRSRKRKILIGAGVILLVAMMAIIILARPVVLQDVPTAQEANARIFDLLVSGGVTESMVDVTPERVLVRYNLPVDAEAHDEEWAFWFTVGAVHEVAPDSAFLVLQVYRDFEPVEEVTMAMADVTELLAGTIDQEEFESRMERRDIAG